MDQVAGLFRGAVGSDVVIDVLRRGQVLAHPCSSLLLEAHALDLSMFLTSTPFFRASEPHAVERRCRLSPIVTLPGAGCTRRVLQCGACVGGKLLRTTGTHSTICALQCEFA
jgi:hypothetical protein